MAMATASATVGSNAVPFRIVARSALNWGLGRRDFISLEAEHVLAEDLLEVDGYTLFHVVGRKAVASGCKGVETGTSHTGKPPSVWGDHWGDG